MAGPTRRQERERLVRVPRAQQAGSASRSQVARHTTAKTSRARAFKRRRGGEVQDIALRRKNNGAEPGRLCCKVKRGVAKGPHRAHGHQPGPCRGHPAPILASRRTNQGLMASPSKAAPRLKFSTACGAKRHSNTPGPRLRNLGALGRAVCLDDASGPRDADDGGENNRIPERYQSIVPQRVARPNSATIGQTRSALLGRRMDTASTMRPRWGYAQEQNSLTLPTMFETLILTDAPLGSLSLTTRGLALPTRSRTCIEKAKCAYMHTRLSVSTRTDAQPFIRCHTNCAIASNAEGIPNGNQHDTDASTRHEHNVAKQWEYGPPRLRTPPPTS